MHMVRVSGRAGLLATALALALVVGATSGAVAGRLISSPDIKDRGIKSRDLDVNSVKNRNLGRGAVTWEKSLNRTTRARITALVRSGPAGPAGPQGEPGPQGATGLQGGRGPAGPAGGGLVGSAAYDANDFVVVDPGSPSTDAYSRAVGDTIDLPGPGTYLISVQATFLGGSGGSVFFRTPDPAGLDTYDPDVMLEFFAESCTVIGLTPACQVTIPYTVPTGSPASVPLPVFALGDPADLCGCYSLPDRTVVTVFQMDDVPAVYRLKPVRLTGAEQRAMRTQLREIRKAALS